MAEAKPALIQFRPSGLEVELQKRGDSMSTVAKRDLDRYYALLERDLSDLDFTYTESLILVASLKGMAADPRTSHLLWATVEGELRVNRRRWEFLTRECGFRVNEAAQSLRPRMQEWSRGKSQAVFDAVERFERRTSGKWLKVNRESHVFSFQEDEDIATGHWQPDTTWDPISEFTDHEWSIMEPDQQSERQVLLTDAFEPVSSSAEDAEPNRPIVNLYRALRAVGLQ